MNSPAVAASVQPEMSVLVRLRIGWHRASYQTHNPYKSCGPAENSWGLGRRERQRGELVPGNRYRISTWWNMRRDTERDPGQ